MEDHVPRHAQMGAWVLINDRWYNIIEQDHRFIKKITRPMLGFKAFHSASATLKGIEVSHMVRKGQIGTKGQSVFQVIAELAA